MTETPLAILVTGFVPFGGQLVNPAEECVRALPEQIGRVRIEQEILPVDWAHTEGALLAAIERTKARAVLSFGQAGGRTAVTIERVGINLRESAKPDNAGQIVRGEPIDASGADGYFVTLPYARMLSALLSESIPARYSFTAGTYLCNSVLYAALRYEKRRSIGMTAGFVHLPYCTGQSDTAYCMPLAMQQRAAYLCAAAVCRALEA